MPIAAGTSTRSPGSRSSVWVMEPSVSPATRSPPDEIRSAPKPARTPDGSARTTAPKRAAMRRGKRSMWDSAVRTCRRSGRSGSGLPLWRPARVPLLSARTCAYGCLPGAGARSARNRGAARNEASKHATVLVEVAGAEGVREADRQTGDAAGHEIGDALVAFEHPAHAQRRRAARDQPEALPDPARADHVHEPGLVFEVQEDGALRGRGLLAVRHHSGHLDDRTIGKHPQIRGGDDTLEYQLLTDELGRVAPRREP